MTRLVAIIATVLTAASFGFFFTWALTMWGLDTAEPVAAMTSMVAVNEGIRTPLFMVVFAGAPLVTGVAAVASVMVGARSSAVWFAMAAAALVLGVILVTAIGNVPLNETIAALDPAAYGEQNWNAYSGPWQAWNSVRAVTSGVAVASCALALASIERVK